MLGIKTNLPNFNREILSGETKKKVILAKQLFNNLKVLILNKPMGGVGVY